MIPIDELRGAAPEKDCLLPKGGWGPGGSMSGLVKGRTFPLFRYIVYNSISCCHANTANTVNKILVTFAMISHQYWYCNGGPCGRGCVACLIVVTTAINMKKCKGGWREEGASLG